MRAIKTLPSRIAIVSPRVARALPKEAEPVYATARYRVWANAVKSRDGWRCTEPGCDKRAPMHRMYAGHILNVRDHPELAFDVANGRCLCASHNVAEGIDDRRRRLEG